MLGICVFALNRKEGTSSGTAAARYCGAMGEYNMFAPVLSATSVCSPVGAASFADPQ
jgi:hypothetical protein